MTATALRSSQCVSELTLTAEAVRIADRLEREIIRHELAVGRDHILRVVSGFGGEVCATHTCYYRRVVRETTWPHGTWVGGAHADFLRGYECSALGYVWTGFEALRYFAGTSDWSIDEVYADAIVAESLRGQFGKSSPDGLDRRLAQFETRFLAEFGDEEDLLLLCTPAEPIRTAETSFLDDLADFRQVFPTPPSIADVLDTTGQDQETAWRFLRRHVRWSVSAVAPLYDGVPISVAPRLDPSHLQHAEWRRRRLLAQLPKTAIDLVDSITSLNVLNLVLEPSFSFKGCVGLPLGVVFRKAQHVERRPPLDQVQVLLGKLNLFNLAFQRSRHDGQH